MIVTTKYIEYQLLVDCQGSLVYTLQQNLWLERECADIEYILQSHLNCGEARLCSLISLPLAPRKGFFQVCVFVVCVDTSMGTHSLLWNLYWGSIQCTVY